MGSNGIESSCWVLSYYLAEHNLGSHFNKPWGRKPLDWFWPHYINPREFKPFGTNSTTVTKGSIENFREKKKGVIEKAFSADVHFSVQGNIVKTKRHWAERATRALAGRAVCVRQSINREGKVLKRKARVLWSVFRKPCAVPSWGIETPQDNFSRLIILATSTSELL